MCPQVLSQDVSIALDIRAQDIHVSHAQAKRSSTRANKQIHFYFVLHFVVRLDENSA